MKDETAITAMLVIWAVTLINIVVFFLRVYDVITTIPLEPLLAMCLIGTALSLGALVGWMNRR